MNKYIFFGASKRAEYLYKILAGWDCEVLFFTDNNEEKWGTELLGKPIKSPKELFSYKEKIIIASTYEKEIKEQLMEMGLESRIIEAKEVFYLSIKFFFEKHTDFSSAIEENVAANRKTAVIFDTLDGVGWGGMEIWSYTMAAALKESGVPILVMGTTEQTGTTVISEEYIKRFDMGKRFENESYVKVVSELVNTLARYLPIVAVSNWNRHLLIAAHILKEMYPEKVKIISVQHNDDELLYKKQRIFKDYIDVFFCVSSRIKDTLVKHYGIPSDKVFFKESMTEYDVGFIKSYSSEGSLPLRIGYAARLESIQKRSELLPFLIGEFEKRNINYIFEIAGDGTQKELIENYVKDNQLGDKVKVLGVIPKTEMADFWKRQDVFLNISAFEGTSLSMLEAMSYGVIPVVTNVSGVDDFVEFGENGYFCGIEKISLLADYIKEIDDNREHLKTMGEKCRKEINKRCKKEDYVSYFKTLIRKED